MSTDKTHTPLADQFPDGLDPVELNDEQMKQLVIERYAGVPEACEWHVADSKFWKRFIKATHEVLTEIGNTTNALNTDWDKTVFKSRIIEYKNFCEQHGVTPDTESLEALV